LKEFPNGLHRAEATKAIEKGKESVVKRELDMCHTIDDYQRFIAKYPQSKLRGTAEYIIELLVYEAALATKQYNNYYSRYPNGHFVTMLKEGEEQRLYKSCTTTKELKQFVKSHPDSKYATLASEVIKRDRRKNAPKWIMSILGAAILVMAMALLYSNFQHTPSSKSVEAETERPSVSALGGMNLETDSSTADAESTEDTNEEYKNNSLKTGSKPYASSFGKAQTGTNYFYFKTSESDDKDFVIIVRRSRDNRYVNHTYIKGGETAQINVPDGTYNVYFYSGKGWNPNKVIGERVGGFVDDETLQKDGPVKLFSAYMEYTLFPVFYGNLRLENASKKEAFN